MKNLPAELVHYIATFVPNKITDLCLVCKSLSAILGNLRFGSISLGAPDDDPAGKLRRILRKITQRSELQQCIQSLTVTWPDDRLASYKDYPSNEAVAANQTQVQTVVRSLEKLVTPQEYESFLNKYNDSYFLQLIILLSLSSALHEIILQRNQNVYSYMEFESYIRDTFKNPPKPNDKIPSGLLTVKEFSNIDQSFIDEAEEEEPEFDHEGMYTFSRGMSAVMLPSLRRLKLHALREPYGGGDKVLDKFQGNINCKTWLFSCCDIDNRCLLDFLKLPKALKLFFYEFSSNSFGNNQDVWAFRDGVHIHKKSLETFCFTLSYTSCFETDICLGSFHDFPYLKHLYVPIELLLTNVFRDLYWHQEYDSKDVEDSRNTGRDGGQHISLTKILPPTIEEFGMDCHCDLNSDDLEALFHKVIIEVVEKKKDTFPAIKVLAFSDKVLESVMDTDYSSSFIQEFFDTINSFDVRVLKVYQWEGSIKPNRTQSKWITCSKGRIINP